MPSDLFLPVGITVPATEAFLVNDLFKRDLSDEARVKILEVGSNFHSWFGGMTVDSHAGSTLNYRTLARRALESEIIEGLG